MDALSSALAGMRVVSLALNIPGPVAAWRLAQMGAEVVKIEPLRGDPVAVTSPLWYEELHRNVEVVRCDLRAQADRANVLARLANADLFISSIRASALVRAGLGWETLRTQFGRLSQIAIVGETSPNADRAGHDLTYQAQAGLLAPPAMPRTVIGDLAAAERAVWAALAAVHQRDRSGAGCYVEIGIVDAANAFAVPLRYGLTSSTGYLGGALPAYNLYRARDGWVAVAALEPHFEERLRALTGLASLEYDAIASVMATRDAAEWERLGSEHDLPLSRVV